MRERGKTLEMYGFEDLGSRCRKHPSQPSVGICAMCLKDRLSKLVCSDCGERRPSSCSCSEASSSSDAAKNSAGKTGTVDIGSVGRISFLIESDKVDLEDPLIGNFRDVKSRPSKPDAIVLLKRSKSAACSTGRTAAPATAVAAALDSRVCALKPHAKKSHFWSFWYLVRRKRPGRLEGSEQENKPAEPGAVCRERGLDACETGETPGTHRGSANENQSPLWIFPSLGSRLFRSRSVGCGRSSFSMDPDDTPGGLVAGMKCVVAGNGKAPCEGEPATAEQSNHGKPIDASLPTEKGKEGRYGGFRKTGGAFHSISSMISEDGNQIPGGSNARGRGWSWRLSGPIRIFKHSYRRKMCKEVKNSHGGSVGHDTGNASASPADDGGALIEIDRG